MILITRLGRAALVGKKVASAQGVEQRLRLCVAAERNRGIDAKRGEDRGSEQRVLIALRCRVEDLGGKIIECGVAREMFDPGICGRTPAKALHGKR